MSAQLIQFIIKHWILVGAFVFAFILLLVEEARAQAGRGGQFTAARAVQLINHDNAVVFDLRDASAFREGHIVHAKNFPLSEFDRHEQKWVQYRSQTIILVDAMGMKTNAIATRLKQTGFEKVYVLKSGMSGWLSANMPVVKK